MVSAGTPCPFFQVDVFSARPGAGNPLAVVIGAGRFDDARMQAIAAWNNLAETTFLLPPTVAGADYRVRIFTTRREIAFAGHPSIGSAHVARSAGLVDATAPMLVQECQAGLLPVRIEVDRSTLLSVRVPRSRIVRRGQPSDVGLTASLTGLALGALSPAMVEGGRRWWLAELANEDEVRRMQPDRDAIRGLAEKTDSLGLCVFARTPGSSEHELVVRAFPVGVGIDEDPASGAANAAIAAFLDETDSLGPHKKGYRVSQGREMGRDARLVLRIDEDRQVWVGGECQSVVRGTFRW